jgi:predicted TIM-barrel fold metal-dependent hydrolase
LYRVAPDLVESRFDPLVGTKLRELVLTPKHVARPYLPEDYAADAHGVATAAGAPITSIVHVEAAWQATTPLAAADETKWLTTLPFGEGNLPELAAIVAHADPRAPDCGRLLDAHREASPKVTCVRLNAAWHPDSNIQSWSTEPGLLRSNNFLHGFTAIAERHLSFDATVYSAQLADVAVLAHEFPETTIVLSHYGTPIGLFGPMGSTTGRTIAQRSDIARRWKEQIATLAEHPNVVAKHSGFAFPQLGFGLDPEGNIGGRETLTEIWRPLINHVADAFGGDRLMFGSNYPMDKPNASLPDIVGMLVEVLSPRGEDLLRKVFHDNAMRIYQAGGVRA